MAALTGTGEKHNATDNTKPWRISRKRNALNALRLAAERVDNIVLERSWMRHFFGSSQMCSLSSSVNCMLTGKQTSRHIQNLSLELRPQRAKQHFWVLQRQGRIRNQTSRWSHVYTTGKERCLRFFFFPQKNSCCFNLHHLEALLYGGGGEMVLWHLKTAITANQRVSHL